MTHSSKSVSSAPTLGAILYTRVSTGRQAETDLSIPDQRRQLRAWCDANGFRILAEYNEAGASATDDKRLEFQRMIDHACDGTSGVNTIVVHSFSRFMRDSFSFEFYARKLAKCGVKLKSITQDVNDDDPAQVMMRKILAVFDEHQSHENAKHVLRSMKENARQGFWNGSTPPFGYQAVEVERRGARIKKRLIVDLVEAEFVRLVFKLYIEGHDGSGPTGVKAVTTWLNKHGYRTRNGATWAIGPVHKMLTNPVYMGEMRFNQRDSRLGQRKAETEHILFEVPPLLDRSYFRLVQDTLKSRNPRVTPPRVVSGPILLTGLAVCATCEGGMTLRTGTSRTGKVHRYYTCSKCAREGKSECKGRSIRMDKLDDLVTEHLIDRLLDPARLSDLLSSLAARRAVKSAAIDERISGLEARAGEAEVRLRRLYKLVEDGLAEMDEILKARILELSVERDATRAAVVRATSSSSAAPADISPAQIEQFGRLMRERLTTGGIPFRKAYLGAIIDRVEVDDHQIRIRGRKDLLERAVVAGSSSAVPVRRFVRNWRARKDSNL
jgi:site-specific DNA recombinase